MAGLKTKPQDTDPRDFLNSIEDDKKRQDALTVLDLMQDVTGEEPMMWGESIIGYGSYDYHYASGREASWFLVGFSPRKRNLTLYLNAGFDEYDDLLDKLGKHKTGKACLYVNKLADVDLDVLRELVKRSAEHLAGSDST